MWPPPPAGRCLTPASGSGLKPSSAFSFAANSADLSEKRVHCFVCLLSCVCVPARLDPSGSCRRQTLCNNLAFTNQKQGCEQIFILLFINQNLFFWLHVRQFFFCIFSTDLSSHQLYINMNEAKTSGCCCCCFSIQVHEICTVNLPSVILDSH